MCPRKPRKPVCPRKPRKPVCPRKPSPRLYALGMALAAAAVIFPLWLGVEAFEKLET